MHHHSCVWHANPHGAYHHKIRSCFIASCSTIRPIKLRLSWPDPLQSLTTQVPLLDDLRLYTAKTEAGVTLLKAVRKKLISSPRVRQADQLVEIERPFAEAMKLLKPSLTREFNQYVPFKVSFTLTVIVSIVSTVLHLPFMYFHHRFNLRDRVFPKTPTKSNAIRPVLQVQKECLANVSEKISEGYYLISHNANESSETPPNVPQKTPLSDSTQMVSASSAASEPSYANTPRFVITDTTQEREYVHASNDKILNNATTTA